MFNAFFVLFFCEPRVKLDKKLRNRLRMVLKVRNNRFGVFSGVVATVLILKKLQSFKSLTDRKSGSWIVVFPLSDLRNLVAVKCRIVVLAKIKSWPLNTLMQA